MKFAKFPRRAGRPALALALLGAALAAACGDSPVEVQPRCAQSSPATPLLAAAELPASPYDAQFAAAAAEFGVPAPLLKAVAYVETRWQMVEGHEEFPGWPAAFGVMALRGERLERGARLAGVSAAAARRDPLANVRAAAALLAAEAAGTGVDRNRLESWADAVASFSGIELPAGRASYVGDGVYRVLREGVEGPWRESANGPPAASSAIPPCPEPVSPVDFRSAVWRASPNFNARAADSTGVIHMVIIHTCEGAYAGCWSWLSNTASQVSAHYVVDEEGREITQLVQEPARAWHIGARYDCELNLRHDCWLNDVQSNHFTVGVEHAGYASQKSFPPAQLDASARLVCDIARRRGVARDGLHVVAHGQLQPYNRTDPGPNWPWKEYIALIQRHCGDAIAPGSEIAPGS